MIDQHKITFGCETYNSSMLPQYDLNKCQLIKMEKFKKMCQNYGLK